ncbi:MAG: hypothetical protein KDK39_13650 [Leptospiraceae bacterium]|nr:hypothetical protein [Leptospiraceae bacterium]
MNKVIQIAVIGLAIGFLPFSRLAAQEAEKGVCFRPVDKDHDRCVDFDTSWYYAVQLSSGWLLNVRPVNSPAIPHIWNGGQYLISAEEWKKIESALSSKGLSTACPPPSYRTERDKLKSRAELCKQ